jgi:peptidoglycan/LPS O-acetylase OafA/YrhL
VQPRIPDDFFRFGWILMLTTAAAALSWFLLKSRLIEWRSEILKDRAAMPLNRADSP